MVSSLLKAARKAAKEAKDLRKQTDNILNKKEKTSNPFSSIKKFPKLSKEEESLVASSSAPIEEIAGLGRVKTEKINTKDIESSKKRFDKLKKETDKYKQERAKARVIKLPSGETAIQYMTPPTEVKNLKLSDLIATQSKVITEKIGKTNGELPLIVKKDGKFYIRDGHHRIAKKVKDKDKTADVRLIDLDEGGFYGIEKTPQGTGQQEFTQTRKAYKLFVQREDGGLYPLFVDADTRIPENVFTEANFPKTAFEAPNGKLYVPSKGAKRAKGEKAKGTGEQIIVPDADTRKKLIDAGFSVSSPAKGAEHGKVLAVAARPGYHASQFPVATHIGPEDLVISKKERDLLLKSGITPEAIKFKTFFYDKDGKQVSKRARKKLSADELSKLKQTKKFYVKRRAEDHVYAEVDMADDVDYQSMLLKEGKTDINDRVPVGGSYKYVDGQADSDNWVVGGNMKVNRVLSREEVKNIQQSAKEGMGVKDLPYKEEVENILGRKFAEGGLVEGDDMQQGIDDYVVAKTESETMDMNVGGAPKKNLEAQQLEMFGDIGMAKSPAKKDPVSGNEIPKASTAEEVRDDIPARLSEGEFVLPADVVRYHGLEKLMNLRQEAKQGINTMDKMGQLGNAEEATMPDDLPFDVNDIEMQEGGFVNPTGTYQVPSNIATTPSYFQNYAQTTAPFTPFVPPKQTAIPPVAPVTPPKTTGPTFQTLIPSEGQRPVTKEYRNAAGQKLFIPFINDKPIYPIPEGYTEYVEEKEATPEKDKKPAVTTQTTTVTGDDSSEDTSVRSTTQRGVGAGRIIDVNFDRQTPEQIKKNLGEMSQGDRGLSVLSALEKARGSAGLSRRLEQLGTIAVPGVLAMKMYEEGTFNPLDVLEKVGAPDPSTLNNILGSYGYMGDDDTDPEGTQQNYLNALSQAVYGKSYADASRDLGVAPTFRRGKKPGDIDVETGNTYDSDGQAGGAYEVPSYASFADFQKAMSASLDTGFYGSKATAQQALRENPNNKKAQAYLDKFKVETPITRRQAAIDDKIQKDKEAKKAEDKLKQDRIAEKIRQDRIAEAQRKAGEARKAAEAEARRQEIEETNRRRAAEDKARFGTVTPQDSDSGGDSGSFGGDSGGGFDTGEGFDSGTGFGSDISTAVGGFIKKPKTKVKKMKRGGLASR